MKKLLCLALASLVTMPLHAEDRMISAGFGVTEIIYALGAQDKLVGADFTSRHLIEGNEDIAQLGLHVRLSAEGVMALRPTHLIGTDEIGPQTAIKQIAKSGVEVVTIPSGQHVPQLLSRIDTLAAVMGHPTEAKQLKQSVTSEIEKLEHKQCQTKPKAIFFMLDRSGATRVGGADTAIDTIITLAGAINPAQAHFKGYRSTSMEAMLEMQPDYILVSQRAWDMYQSADKILDKLPVLKSTPAGINKNILVVPSGALLGGFGLASIEVAKELNQTFCPQ
ncbi:heme/hemin ABC transporter substrate-binding protein [Vibrio harveyi]|uniref:heme/hemin ABC transporter substrate-binding protein n=1 Tax=Vibrio harveyi TaxID=669 RepID=UPI002ED14F21|nr:ABC transporter substrate-binding protein [Vibrio harveyi]